MQNTTEIPKSRRREPTKFYRKMCFIDMYANLMSLRKHETFCDVKLKTDDNKIIFAHKVILAAASPYFHAMFTHFSEQNCDLVVLKQLNHTAVKLLVNFIYSGALLITNQNVQVLLPAADLLLLREVKKACCDFLLSQLCLTNCIDIYALSDLYSCTTLLTNSELYIQQHFSEVVGDDEFLSLSSEQVIKLISSDKLKVASEEKVFESVIRWVKYDLYSRKCILPQLMEHVRLPLTSKDFILKKVVQDPLIKSCVKCNQYVIEALIFHTHKSDELIPQNIRNTPRHGYKVIFVVGGLVPDINNIPINSTQWYNPQMNQWHYGPEMITRRSNSCIAVLKDNLVFTLGGTNQNITATRSVEMLDLSSESPCWVKSVNMLVRRVMFGVGVINDCLYAIGGFNNTEGMLNNAEVFDYNTQKWRMVSSMFDARIEFGIGVVDNLLYVAGGYDSSIYRYLKSVERYDPSIDTWTQVAKLPIRRSKVGVGVLDGVLYAVGGYNGFKTLRCVQKYNPSTDVWTKIPDMNLARSSAGVVALNGLLYVVGGFHESAELYSMEYYNPATNTWTMAFPKDYNRSLGAYIAINWPKHFKMDEH